MGQDIGGTSLQDNALKRGWIIPAHFKPSSNQTRMRHVNGSVKSGTITRLSHKVLRRVSVPRVLIPLSNPRPNLAF